MMIQFDLVGLLFAYIGPGLGAGAVAIVCGFIGSIFLAVFALVWFPLKRLFKAMRRSVGDRAIENDAGAAQPIDPDT
ncbi:hypothetical protein [Stratiformator vulcanicus]|uniref:Uncharacterized protein n=1 Tax=Stratiformator vulcanicus TaxID=2527980 RepID=A0A517R6G3_9PLAN|nr:hypothetical protein [Stratiformator vulcanicus]QDT39468.1 hypothetical protein Pan189_38760 [Stratiformator vulcanicus]